ncbi:hypothetical protein OG203_06565 [Nocardia sp. NBC_01499]
MEPFDAETAEIINEGGDQCGADTVMVQVGGNHGVEEERVSSAIPNCVNEADQALIDKCPDPGSAVPFELFSPRGQGVVAAEGVGVQA